MKFNVQIVIGPRNINSGKAIKITLFIIPKKVLKLKRNNIIAIKTTPILPKWWFIAACNKSIPIIPLVALRFSFQGVSIATMIMGFLLIWRSTHLGVFDDIPPETDLLLVQFVIAANAISGYLLATVLEAQDFAR